MCIMSLTGTWAGESELHAYTNLLGKDDLIKVYQTTPIQKDSSLKKATI